MGVDYNDELEEEEEGIEDFENKDGYSNDLERYYDFNFNISNSLCKILDEEKDKINDDNKSEISKQFSIIEKNNEYFNLSLSDCEFKEFFKDKNNFQGIVTVAKLFDYLSKLKNEQIFKDTVIRCIFMKKDNSFFQSCDEIPFIKKDNNHLIFFDEKNRGKCLDIFELLSLIFSDKLFLKIRPENKNIIDNAYICKNHNKNYFSYCKECQKNICEICIKNNNEHFNHKIFVEKYENFFLRKVIAIAESNISKKFFHFIKNVYEQFKTDYKNYNKNYKFYRSDQFKKKIYNLFKYFECNFILYIYCYIIKRLVCEQIFMNKNKIFNYYIYKNILDFHKQFKKNHLKSTKRKYEKLEWIIKFHSKEEKNKIKENKNNNIYIGIIYNGNVVIYSFNVLNNFQHVNKNNYYEIINYKNINIIGAQRIIRLENCYNSLDESNYYFLISSVLENKAIIIKITSNYKLIEIIQTIDYNKGLIFCYEFQYKNKFYLLNCSNYGFSLWYYDIKEKKLKYRPLEEKSENNKKNIINEEYKQTVNRIINFIEKLNLIVVHIIVPKVSLNLYKLEEINQNLFIVLKDKIIPKDNQNIFSKQFNNCCVIKNKYLIIGARSNKNIINENNGGFYVINLEGDKYNIINYTIIKNSNYVNSFINFKENIFICTNSFTILSEKKKRKTTKYELLSYQIIEGKKGDIQIEKISQTVGNYFCINCNKLIGDGFLISSNRKHNSITKIKENGIFSYKTCASFNVPSNKQKDNNNAIFLPKIFIK